MGLGGFFKKALGGLGDIAKFAAPIANFIPGVGPLAAGAIGLGGGLLGQLNDQDPSLGAGLKQGAISGLGSYGFGKGLDAFNAANPGGGFLGQLGGGIKGIGGLLGGAGQAGLNIPGLALGGINSFMNAQDATRYRGIQDDQINYAKDQQARQQQIQDQILGNLNPALNVPDLNNVFADPSNPFYTGLTPPTPAVQGVGGSGMGVPSVGGGSIGSMLKGRVEDFAARHPLGEGQTPDVDVFGVYGKGRIPPPQDPANDVMRRLKPIPSTGGGGGRVVPMDYRF